MIRRRDIGEAIVNAGFTWSDGFLREKRTVNELVLVIEKVLVDSGYIVVTPADELKYDELVGLFPTGIFTGP